MNLFSKFRGRFKVSFARLVYTLHKVLPPLFSHLQSQHITCPALCGVSDLELAQKAATGQALQPQGIA